MSDEPAIYTVSPVAHHIYRVMKIVGNQVHIRNLKLGSDMLIEKEALENLWTTPTEDEIAKAILLGQIDSW